jgi:hypothetical protein
MFDENSNGDRSGECGLVHVGTSGVVVSGGLVHVDTSGVSGGLVHVGRSGVVGWREIDRALKQVAKARGRLDAEELLWLARAERVEIHREFGHATILEYVERVLGYGPRVARERLRVARALETLPRLRDELESARLAYSAVREVSRVATPANEQRWIERVTGKSLREIEEAVAGHRPGDDPDDPIKPDLVLRSITFELSARTLALYRDAARMLEEEVGHPLTEDEIFAILCASALRDDDVVVAIDDAHAVERDERLDESRDDVGVEDTGRARAGMDDDPGTHVGSEDDPRAHVGTAAARTRARPPAPYQIALTICAQCKRATHDAAGRSFDVSASVVEQAMCHAQFLGRVDLDEPARASRNIPAATVRAVWRRDGGRCVVPGCRSTRHIEVHHINWRSRGGDNSAGNLACLCFAHHAALHDGKLMITGRVPNGLVFERIDPLLACQRQPRDPVPGAPS